ncbi:MAG: thiol peroxidase [Kiritimatiellae bacterium]|nr:thiol peroxidase [Kiritimatiellia bacterium]MDD5522526.1 thiol peroxidase [Kiritimatiellia bacterium]
MQAHGLLMAEYRPVSRMLWISAGKVAGIAGILLFSGCLCGHSMKGKNAMDLNETNNLVTMRGKPLVLLGDQVAVGDTAPDFKTVDGSFKQIKLSDFKGKACLISAVPSLDTQVCALQTKRFNSEVGTLPSSVVMMTISMDLPFAQKRFCEAEKIDRILVLSDHVWHDFGTHYGILIKDMGLLARSVFIVGQNGKLIYKQIVPDLSQQPNYDGALEAVRQAAGSK